MAEAAKNDSRNITETPEFKAALDAALAKVDRENSSAGRQILASVQYDGLYPPSAI